LNRIDSALVGFEPPQTMPAMRYSMRPPTRHFSTRTGIAAVSMTAGVNSRASRAPGAWCVRAANSCICGVAGASSATRSMRSTHLMQAQPYQPGTIRRTGEP